MGIYSLQQVYCSNCGTKMGTDFQYYGGEVCSKECWEELQWKKALSIMGKEYRPKKSPPATEGPDGV